MNILLEAIKAGFRNVHNRIPKKLSDLTIDVDLNKVKTVNDVEPDKNGNVKIDMPEPEILVATYGVTKSSEIETAVNEGKLVIVHYNEKIYTVTYSYGSIYRAFYFMCIHDLGINCILVDHNDNWTYRENLDIFLRSSRTIDVINPYDIYADRIPTVGSIIDYALPTTYNAVAGQILVVDSVDANGKPTAIKAKNITDVIST